MGPIAVETFLLVDVEDLLMYWCMFVINAKCEKFWHIFCCLQCLVRL